MNDKEMLVNDVFVSLVTVVGSHNSPNLQVLVEDAVNKLEANYSNFELILVDNGLGLDVFSNVATLLANVPCIRIVKLSQNKDFDAAAFSGIEAAIGDYIAFFEIEIDPVERAIDALSQVIHGADIVQGLVGAIQGNVMRRISRKIFFGFSKTFAGLDVSSSATYLTAFTRSVCNALASSPSGLKYLRHLLGHIGFSIVYFQYERPADSAKRRRPGFFEAVEVLTSYSLRPLRVVSALGLIAALFNLAYTIYVILTFLSSEVERGWASTNLQLGSMFFLLFLSLSLISEYIGRILSESQKQSSYIVKEELVSSRLIANEHRRNID
jgi:glycosyltransferase involved in cell wall biosynthesis